MANSPSMVLQWKFRSRDLPVQCVVTQFWQFVDDDPRFAPIFQSNVPAIVACSLTVPILRMFILQARHSLILQLMTTHPFQSIPTKTFCPDDASRLLVLGVRLGSVAATDARRPSTAASSRLLSLGDEVRQH
jgi:hypothetical protein